ncbi:hypothetical protein A3L12_03915 [Thermococcus sp. P6]|uniref:hypothetical protein n=1 Tax=Thermococcus sp. P6 TaxID=122420 RepID=UPI000B59AC23|nr:hypothetical protein [Thermococcus sp. P6]ASJ11311.1 hypothetical protein A3L12_03915 [Thermococcus sp. P6]
MSEFNWGRTALYTGLLILLYVLSGVIGPLRVLMVPAGVLVLFLVGGDVAERARGRNAAFIVRTLGVSFSAILLPWEWSFSVALIALGAGTAALAPRLRDHSRLIRGTGLVIAFYGISRLPPLGPAGSVFSYAGVFLFLGYAAAELGEGHPWAEPIERNLLGMGILGGILGLYATVRESLIESHPSMVFYGEWLALLLGVIVAGSMVHSYVGEKDPEGYLLSQWKRHEAETMRKLGPEMRETRKAVEDFVVRGRKGPLLAFIAYYGSRLFDERRRFEALIGKIADYRAREVSRLTPLWIRRAYERRELERRAGIVEEVFGELRKLMGWES